MLSYFAVISNLALNDRRITFLSSLVGNIPYEATDEQLKDIFSQAGPVLSFR